MTTTRRAVAACAAAALVLLCPGVAMAAGTHDPRMKASALDQRLEAARAAVTRAQEQLAASAAAARAAIDRYDRAMHRLRTAQSAADTARATLAAAVADVVHAQELVNSLARASYISGGPLGPVASVLTAGGPGAILDQASMLGAVSRSQAELLHSLAAALQWQQAMSTTADAAEQAVQRIADRAAVARRTALGSMASQHALIKELMTQQISVALHLAHGKVNAALTVDQAAGRARANAAAESAELAAAWLEMQAAGDAMPWATAKQGRSVVAWAKKELGVPYSWGGGDANGPTFGAVNEDGNTAGLRTAGFDCSGLALFAWAKVGFPIDHYTGYQWVEGHHIDVGKMRRGDLVFFATDTSDPLTIHHVGIYVGGDRIIDAPHTGANVRYDKVFVPGFIGAVRP
jgi:peptidoglycan DL-endopeptidase RipA